MADSYFIELKDLEVTNDLHRHWINYALSLTRDDILTIVRGGLTHQATALKSMMREIISGTAVKRSLMQKLDAIDALTKQTASTMR